MIKQLLRLWAGVAFVLVAGVASAAPYSVTFSDTASSLDTFPAGVSAGQQFTAKVVFDNGGTTATNQSWSADNVQCMIFTFNNAQDKFMAMNYSGAGFTSTSGNFTTDGSGLLQAGTIDWFDDGPIAVPQASNIAGFTNGAVAWFLNGANDVVNFNSSNVSVGFVNVGNDTTVTNWTNPVPAPGACAALFLPKAPALPVPTLGEWAMILLSILLAAGGILARRRQRH